MLVKMRHPYPPFSAIEAALSELILGARLAGIHFKHTELAEFPAEWDPNLVVLIFYEYDADVQTYDRNGTREWVEDKFIEELNEVKAQFRFTELPKIQFEFDSVENVKKNYQGSYFFRLRAL